MANNEYALLRVFFDGRAVKNISAVHQKTNSGLVPIKVLNFGFVGVSKGAGEISITGTMFVPSGGFEEPVQTWAVEGSEHTIQIGCGPSDFVGSGWFFECDLGQETDQGTNISFTFNCPPDIFE
jgi:hypothetical protein